jgi:hypothetical protein
MNKDTILGIVRHILTFAGGFAVTKGLADEGTSTEVIGALVTIVGAVWSIVAKRAAKPATPAA